MMFSLLIYLRGCSSIVFSLVGNDWYIPRLSFGIVVSLVY